MDDPKKERSAIRNSALNLLARREHSRHELATKLARKFPDVPFLAEILDRLEEEDLLSDSRFAGAFLRSRVRKGQGPYRVRQELQQKGVSEELVEHAFTEESVDWFEQAREVADRRFGQEPPKDFQERGKRGRFLQYRGFSGDQIRYALENAGDE